MIHAPDVRPHAAALSSLLTSLPGGVFALGEVPGLGGNPGTVPDCYLLLQVDRMPLPVMQSSRISGRTSWWVQVRVVDRSAHNCDLLVARVTQALENGRLQVAGHESTPLAFDVSDPVKPDDGLYSAAVSYTYSL